MPTARTQLSTVFGADGKLYAFGGYTLAGVTGAVEVYDPGANSWSTRAPMKTPRYGTSAVLGSDNLIYVIGGQYDDTGNVTDYPSLVVETYDPAHDKWADAPSLNLGRYGGASAIAKNGRIYTMGGYHRTTNEILASVESFAPGEAAWTLESSPMMAGRVDFAAAVEGNGGIVAAGGKDNLSEVLDTAEAFAPGAGWSTLPSMPTGMSAGAGARGADGMVRVIAGWAQGDPFAMALFDGSSWQFAAPNLPTERSHFATATGPDGRIFAAGGEANGAPVKVMEVLAP